MKLGNLFLLLSAAAVLFACTGDRVTGPECVPVTSQIASTSGDTVTTTTGLRYIVTAAGEGRQAQTCRAAAVTYDLYVDGRLLDSSSRTQQGYLEIVIGYGMLIPGFEEGVVGMQVGEQRRLIVPPALGYGSEPRRDQQTGEIVIPGNSVLVFDIELLAAQ
jgi:FKBP-type peptidyl-prolyl cis-trans isomerase